MEVKDFIERYNTKPTHFYKAPARVNVIGEHIDYNGGNVLPCAIDLSTDAYVAIRNDKTIRLYSDNTLKEVVADLDKLSYDKNLGWANYPLGIFYVLLSKGCKIDRGLDIYYSSNIPLGSGLSSSASILDLTAYIVNDIFKLGYDNKSLALLAQESENTYNGLSAGVMDEFAIAMGKEGSCIYLNTATLDYSYIPFELGDYQLVVLNTCKPRLLTESKYNERVKECNEALAVIKKEYNIEKLCELKVPDLPRIKKLLNNDVLYRRVKHCVTEQDRVIRFVNELKKGNILNAGKLLNESHESLKHDYEVTGLNLDAITEAARQVAVGARMTGAGFSGCAIAIVKKDKVEELKKIVLKEYKDATGLDGEVLIVDVVGGPSGKLL